MAPLWLTANTALAIPTITATPITDIDPITDFTVIQDTAIMAGAVIMEEALGGMAIKDGAVDTVGMVAASVVADIKYGAADMAIADIDTVSEFTIPISIEV
jgi:hypothetical protein